MPLKQHDIIFHKTLILPTKLKTNIKCYLAAANSIADTKITL